MILPQNFFCGLENSELYISPTYPLCSRLLTIQNILGELRSAYEHDPPSSPPLRFGSLFVVLILSKLDQSVVAAHKIIVSSYIWKSTRCGIYIPISYVINLKYLPCGILLFGYFEQFPKSSLPLFFAQIQALSSISLDPNQTPAAACRSTTSPLRHFASSRLATSPLSDISSFRAFGALPQKSNFVSPPAKPEVYQS